MQPVKFYYLQLLSILIVHQTENEELLTPKRLRSFYLILATFIERSKKLNRKMLIILSAVQGQKRQLPQNSYQEKEPN